MSIGHNNPPAKLELREKKQGLLPEIENWLDGQRVENEDQMAAVDDLTLTVKTLTKEFDAEKEVEYRPHKAACDAVVAEYKPDLKDLDDWVKGLNAINGAFKIQLAAAKKAEADEARREAQEAARLAQIAQEQADYGNLDERRHADEQAAAAREIERNAQALAKEKPKGLRTTKRTRVTNYKALINHIARSDKDAVAAFCDIWAANYYRENKEVIDGCFDLVAETKAV